MSDLIEGRITPGVGNAVCNAGGKLLKVVEYFSRLGKLGSRAAKSRAAIARSQALTPRRRSQIAKKAAKARWAKKEKS